MTTTLPKAPSNNGDVEEGVEATTTKVPPLVSKKSSTLNVSDDPFAPREGKTLLWRNVNMTLVRLLRMHPTIVTMILMS